MGVGVEVGKDVGVGAAAGAGAGAGAGVGVGVKHAYTITPWCTHLPAQQRKLHLATVLFTRETVLGILSQNLG